jgi:hypothetical protein
MVFLLADVFGQSPQILGLLPFSVSLVCADGPLDGGS